MSTLADLEARIVKIEKYLTKLRKWDLSVAKELQKVDLTCVANDTGCAQNNPQGGGVPSDPPPYP